MFVYCIYKDFFELLGAIYARLNRPWLTERRELTYEGLGSQSTEHVNISLLQTTHKSI